MRNGLIGIEIGGTKLQIVSGDPEGHVQDRWRFNVVRDLGATGIRQQIEECLRELLDKIQPLAVGVGFGGPVDWRTGRICVSHHVEGWSEFDLGGWLHQITKAPVQVDNDANTAALGEAIQGAGIGYNPVFYVTLGSGVGGGLVADNCIYHGATPGEAEIGHMRLDHDTTVESRCSGWAVDRKIREAKTRNPDALISRLASQQTGGEARHLGRALDEGDATARQILKETAEELAFALSHVTHLFHPQVIIIGGGLSLVGEGLRAAVAAALPRFVMDAFAPGPRIVLAGLGEDAVPTGALELGLRILRFKK